VTRLNVAELILLSAIWGASFLFQRIASPAFGPVALVAIRIGIAAAILVPIAVTSGRLQHVRGRWGTVALIGSLNSAVPFCLFAYATLHVSAGIAAVLNGTVPLFTALVGVVVFRERLPGSKAAGVALGFCGLLILVGDKLTFRGGWSGVAAGLAASLLYAISAHLTRRRLGGVDPMAIAAGSQLVAGLLLLAPAVWWWPAGQLTRGVWGSAIALGVVCTGLAYVFFFRLIASVGPMRTIAVTYLIPVFGVAWGAVLLGEAVTPRMVAGAVVIFLGVAFTTGQVSRLSLRSAQRPV
jgi:drug/metabolite transporter (DMT)-like permease